MVDAVAARGVTCRGVRDGNSRVRYRRRLCFAHTPTVPAANLQIAVVVLRGFLQLNDGEMAAPGQVSDALVEALTASPADLCQRDGVEDSGADALVPLLGRRNDGVERPARHRNLRVELSDERCWAVR